MNPFSQGKRSRFFGLLGVLGLLPLVSAALPHDRGQEYEVTISNLTLAQVFSPVLFATHDSRVALFRLGEAASDELVLLAEDGDNSALRARLEGESGVEDVVSTDGPVPPGESRTIRIRARGNRDRLSLAGMLVTTNDTFAGLEGLELDSRTQVVHALAYDAGSEANTEDCAHIPGPPCGSGGVRHTDGAEGRVYVSNGIHGQGSLDPAQFDWDNPVARIEIRRAGGDRGDD